MFKEDGMKKNKREKKRKINKVKFTKLKQRRKNWNVKLRTFHSDFLPLFYFFCAPFISCDYPVFYRSQLAYHWILILYGSQLTYHWILILYRSQLAYHWILILYGSQLAYHWILILYGSQLAYHWLLILHVDPSLHTTGSSFFMDSS